MRASVFESKADRNDDLTYTDPDIALFNLCLATLASALRALGKLSYCVVVFCVYNHRKDNKRLLETG
jgi:hypothetical protein